MSISPTSNQSSASSSSISEPETQSSSFDNGYAPISSNCPLKDDRIFDSPSPPSQGYLRGEVVSAARDSGVSSEEVKGTWQNHDSVSPHSDAPMHQKTGSVERQGKSPGNSASRGSHHNVESSTTHSGSKHVASRKAHKVSGNSLLNFQYAPIPVSRPQPRVPPRKQKYRKPYNKDLFFQANYRFVILDTGDYEVDSMDPDNMLSLDDVIFLKYATPFPVLCPICLDDPLCPQITSCGHIFCFPCILQYFFIDKDDTKDECWKKCPLCFTKISSNDLHTVRIETVKQYNIGDEVEFVLLTRLKDSFTSCLKNCGSSSMEEGIINSFSKFSLTSNVDLSVQQAMSDLDCWLARADSGLVDDIEKLPYVCAAVKQLEKRKMGWSKRCSLNFASESENSFLSTNAKSDRFGKFSQDKEVRESPLPPSEGSTRTSEHQEKSPSSSYEDNKGFWPPSSDINEKSDGISYNFYQAIDGQNIILHPFNMKCLLHHFGSPDQLPDRITGKILELESVTQSEAMRRRYRFLSHLPLTTTFQLCEISLGGVLPAESFSPFMGEFKDREKQRKRIAQKELKEKIKAEAAANQFFPETHYYSSAASPSYSMDDFKALGSSAEAEPRPAPVIGQCQSFSAVARLGFAAAHDSPALKNDGSHVSPPNDSSSAAGAASSFASVISSAKKHDQAMDAHRANESGKKGKKTARILLSTAGGRRY